MILSVTAYTADDRRDRPSGVQQITPMGSRAPSGRHGLGAPVPASAPRVHASGTTMICIWYDADADGMG